MARKPVASEPIYPDRYENVGRVAEDDGPAYLYTALPQFIDEIRKQYGDWNEFEEWLERRQDYGDS